jgi:hypothetical protein
MLLFYHQTGCLSESRECFIEVFIGNRCCIFSMVPPLIKAIQENVLFHSFLFVYSGIHLDVSSHQVAMFMKFFLSPTFC